MAAEPIAPLVLDSVGRFGLNTQNSPSSLDHQWLTSANNIVLDELGRISSRKGIQQVSESLGAYGVKSIVEYNASDGSKKLFCASNNAVYAVDLTTNPYLLTAVTITGTPTITDSNWQFVNFNNKLFGVQSGHIPLYYNGTTWYKLTSEPGYNPPAGLTTFNPSCVLGEYGRIWVGGMTEKRNTIYYSDTLQANKWNTGAAGQIDLKTVWGGDYIQAIHAFMDKLVIFGTKNIAIYNNPWDPDNMVLDELIEGVGLKARDSVAHIGNEIVFLSNSGLATLSRIVQTDGKMPINYLSVHIRDELALNIVNADMDQCKAAYCLCGGFYILAFPDRRQVYYFDFSMPNQDGTPRVTKFTFNNGEAPTAMLSTVDGTMYMGRGSSSMDGHLAIYRNYYDQIKTDVTATYGTQVACEAAGNTWESTNSNCWETTNQSYTGEFKTVWLDFGRPYETKILKEFFAVIVGGLGMDIDFTWIRDYNVAGDTRSFSLTPTTQGALYVYGNSSALYGTAKYATGINPTEYKIPLSRTGKVVQLQMQAAIKGNKASLQSMTVLAKLGKVR